MKQERLEQVLDGIDPAFLEEAAAFTAAKGRTVWKRAVLLAVCLAVVLAVTVGAESVTSGWDLYFTSGEDGVERPTAKTVYGGSRLSWEKRQAFLAALAEVEGTEEHPEVTYTFETLSEMEDFLETDLPESTLCPLSTEEPIQFRVSRHSGDGYVYFHIEGEYAFDAGERNNWVEFHYNTWGESSISTRLLIDTADYRLWAHEMEALEATASIFYDANGLYPSIAYFKKEDVAYEIRCPGTAGIPTEFLDSLY